MQTLAKTEFEKIVLRGATKDKLTSLNSIAVKYRYSTGVLRVGAKILALKGIISLSKNDEIKVLQNEKNNRII